MCVFCAASPGANPVYVQQATAMGRYLAESGRRVIFGGGRTVYQTYEAKYYDQQGNYLGLRNDTWARFERTKTAEKKKYGDISLKVWSADEIKGLMAEYEIPTRTKERFWNDVKVGDATPRIIKG